MRVAQIFRCLTLRLFGPGVGVAQIFRFVTERACDFWKKTKEISKVSQILCSVIEKFETGLKTGPTL